VQKRKKTKTKVLYETVYPELPYVLQCQCVCLHTLCCVCAVYTSSVCTCFRTLKSTTQQQEEEKILQPTRGWHHRQVPFLLYTCYILYIDLRLDIRSPAVTIYTMSRCVYIVDIYILVKTEDRERSCQRSTTSQPAQLPGSLVLLLFCDVLLLCSDVI
jgi:hypothetical protein